MLMLGLSCSTGSTMKRTTGGTMKDANYNDESDEDIVSSRKSIRTIYKNSG
jgi:hypothetical protein